MPQLDVNTYLPQIVWLLITFTALFLVMWRVVAPRIADVLERKRRPKSSAPAPGGVHVPHDRPRTRPASGGW